MMDVTNQMRRIIMPKTKRLLGLAAVGASVFGLATAYWRRNQTAARNRKPEVQLSRASTSPPKTQPVSRYQKEQIEQVKKHEE
jgi:hypothetical protein